MNVCLEWRLSYSNKQVSLPFLLRKRPKIAYSKIIYRATTYPLTHSSLSFWCYLTANRLMSSCTVISELSSYLTRHYQI